jgi:hypothetical protein
MKLGLSLVLLAACGSPSREPAMSNVAATSSAPEKQAFAIRKFVAQESGAEHLVWIEREHEGFMNTNDPCCGVAYDGDKYNDKLASCAIHDDECAPGFAPVYPGIADDPVCGERRRCVPLPAVRIVVADNTQVAGVDEEDLAIGGPQVAHRQVEIGREGFVTLDVAGRIERVAVDYGSRYTIVVREGRIERVTHD